MIAGRVCLGVGAESLNVIQTSMTALWFKGGRELAMAMGLVLSMSRLGDFLALTVSANIAELFHDFRYSLWFGTILCGLSFVAVIVYGIFDKLAEKHIPNRVVDPSQNQLNFSAVLRFDSRFWVVSFLCMTYYSGIFPFVTFSSAFFHTQSGYSSTTAGYVSSVVTLASMVLSPFLGKFLDVVGRRPIFTIIGSAVIIPAHLILAFTNMTPILSVIIIGLSFSLVPSALWPSIPIIIAEKELATAFGLMAAIQNAGLGGMNYLVGWVVQTYGFETGMIFFAGMDAIGLILGICLFFLDRAKGGHLSSVAGNKPQTVN